MVLHHVLPENLHNILDEISRIIKPGGLLIIREHNIGDNRLDRYLIDVLHEYHDIVLNPKEENKWVGEENKEINNYNTEEYWAKKIIERNFEYVSKPTIRKDINKNPFNNFIAGFKKL